MDQPSNESYHKHLRTLAGRTALLALPAASITLLLPNTPLFDMSSGYVQSTHLLMEMFSVLVSLLVVATSGFAIRNASAGMARPLIFGFTVIAGCDLVHALSIEGMPPMLSESSTSKAIFFWLCGRSFELVTVALIAFQVRLRGSRIRWFGLALAVLVLLIYVGTQHLDQLPVTYVPGQGVTQFKAHIEVFLCLANLAIAGWFWVQYRGQGRQQAFYFACSCFIMGLGELMFTSYLTQGDLQNVIGHLFKVASYGVISIGTFLTGMREPYEQLLASEAAAHSMKAELDALMRQIPAGIFRLDREGRFRYMNDNHARALGKKPDMVIGRLFEDVVPEERRADLSYRWAAALQGAHMLYEAIIPDSKGREQIYAVSLCPETGVDGKIIGAIGVALNATQQRETQRQLMDSLKETSDFKTALDAHAIVAVTDPRGVITRVNEKFCEISKYSSDELVGNTHRIINSGYHPKAFFSEMWKTISSGSVWNGEICNRAKDGSEYWVYTTIMPILGEHGHVQSYVAIRADITERKRYESQVQTMAYQDLLTELPNRRLLMDRLQQNLSGSQRSGQFGALVFLDLDHFKRVNDTMGHKQGDALLRMVAKRLQAHVRQSDTVARFGGDEFVVIYSDLGTNAPEATAKANALGQDLLRAMAADFDVTGYRVNCTSSLGVVMYQGIDTSADELLKQADIALYQAKGEGRNTLNFFDPITQQAYTQRINLEVDLRQAIVNDELYVLCQPIVDLQGRIVAVEMLLRWTHPELGSVSPAIFIPLAEESGLIVAIGSWVLEQGCKQLAEWAPDPLCCNWNLAVNVSARQMRQPEFVKQVLAVMSKYGVPAGKLKLEITEGSLLQDLQDTIGKMRELVSHGVAFAMDDFGTGYSSLSYLKELPLSVVKIDRSFVMNLDSSQQDVTIAKTVIALADNLGLDVVAEGVETERQRELLGEFGCKKFQGFLFSRPVLAPELLATQLTGRATQ